MASETRQAETRPDPLPPVGPGLQTIAREAREVGFTEWEVLRALKQLQGEEDANLETLRRQVIQILRESNPAAAEAYESFNRLSVYTSAENLEPFDRGNIIRSLLKEASVSRAIAKKIGNEVEDKLKDLKIEYLNTALIREMADVKLLEYGHEAAHQRYARVGLPAFEVQKRVSVGPFDNPEILREFNWLNVIPKPIRKMHFAGDVFVSRPWDYGIKPLALTLDFQPTADDFPGALLELVDKVRTLQTFSGAQPSLNSFNVSLAPFLPQGSRKLRQFAQLALRALDAAYRLQPGPRPTIGLDLFTREQYLNRFTNRLPAFRFANELLKALHAEDAPRAYEFRVCLDTKYKLKLLDRNMLRSHPLVFLNCKKAEYQNAIDLLFQETHRGLSSLVSLNLVKLAMEADGDAKRFRDRLDECLAALNAFHETNARELRDKAFLVDAVDLQKLQPGLSLYGLWFAARSLAEKDGEREILAAADAIVQSVHAGLTEKWRLSASTPPDALERFAEVNKRKLNLDAVEQPAGDLVTKATQSFRRGCAVPAHATHPKVLRELIQSNQELILWVPAPA